MQYLGRVRGQCTRWRASCSSSFFGCRAHSRVRVARLSDEEIELELGLGFLVGIETFIAASHLVGGDIRNEEHMCFR